MAKQQINVRVDDDLERRITHLSERTGRTKSFYVTEAIEAFLNDHEDYFLAKDAIDEFRQSDDSAIALEDVQWPS